MTKKQKAKVNEFAIASTEYQEEVRIAIESHLAAIDKEREKVALEKEWAFEESKREYRAKKSFGRTINGAQPVRSNAKYKRWESFRFTDNNKNLPLEVALGKLFSETTYASGAAAHVIKCMGLNLLGKFEEAQKEFAKQNKYKVGKPMVTWATKELECIGIIGRYNLVATMTTNLT